MVSSGWRWWRVGVDFGSEAGEEEEDGVEYAGGEEELELDVGCGAEVYGGGKSKACSPFSSLVSMGRALDVLAILSYEGGSFSPCGSREGSLEIWQ